MKFRRGSGFTAAISVLATIAIFGSQQVPVAAAVKTAARGTAAVPLTASAPSSFFPIAPSFRILNTVTGLCGGHVCHALGAGQSLTLPITGYVDPGTSQFVPTGATAVVLNVTAVNGSSFSILTVYPTGSSVPRASNLNFPAHTALANSVTAQIGTGGAVNIYNGLGTVNVIADVEGYFIGALSTNPAGEYHAIAPIRVCDTRAGQPETACNGLNDGKPHMLGPNTAIKVQIAGAPAYCAIEVCPPNDFIPTDGTEENAIINLTALAGTSNTFLSVVPYTDKGCLFGGAKGAPSYSDVNVNAGGVQANRVFVPLGPGTSPLSVCVYNAVGKVNFIIDADGWFAGTTGSPPPGLQYVAISPTRICDTRSGNSTQCTGHILTAGKARLVTVGTVDGIPNNAQAIIANLTAVAGSSFTFLATYPGGTTTLPRVSDVNVSAGQVLPNLTAITLGGSPGAFNLYNALGNINAIVDVEGWFQ